MTTLQEYLNQKYPTKEERARVEEINIENINEIRKNKGITEELEGGELDLSDYVGLEKIEINFFGLTKITLGTMPNLTELKLIDNNLTSADFLNTLLNPEKLKYLSIFSNNIQPTDIAIFGKFVNLVMLKTGTTTDSLKKGKRNKFYGSLKSCRNLIKLLFICIEATDVDRGLEYLPEKLARNSKIEKYSSIECSPWNINAKCVAIQNELRPFNYDIEAWQLAHPEKTLKARNERIAELEEQLKNTNSDKQVTLQKQIKELKQTFQTTINQLENKIQETQQELQKTKTNEADKLSKIARLETKIQELELTKSTISQQTQTDFQTQNKSTQTDLTAGKIIQLEQKNGQLLKLLQATEQELNNTKQQLQEAQEKLNNTLRSLSDLQSENKELITLQTTIQQLKSKIKLLEQQKETYQEKYNHSLDFIKEIREDIAKM